MKTISIAYIKNIRSNVTLILLGKLTFMFFLLKGILWIGVTTWLIYHGVA